MKLIYSFFAFILSLGFFNNSVLAVGVEYDGYYRLRYHSFYNLDLDSDQKPNLRTYADMRFRLDPTFFITDQVRVFSSWNILDGLVGGDPFRGRSSAYPARSKDVLSLSSGANEMGRQIERKDRSSFLYGGAFSPDAAVETTDLTPIQLRRAWAEIETGYGIAKIGRMPFHLGLGLFANAGDAPDQDVGSTRDRIAFETAFGPYYIMPGIGWMYEGSIDRSRDDSYEYFFLLGRREPGNHISLYVSYLAQDEAIDATQNGDLASSGTSYWIIDLYTEQMFRQVKWELEIALFVGTFLGYDLFALNSASRAIWQRDKLSLLGELGFSSGTSAKDLSSKKLKSFAFNRDYNISQILFEEALPGGARLTGDPADDERASAPRSGAVSNAVYVRSKIDYEVTTWFKPYFNFILPFAVERSLGSGGRFYGFEYNVGGIWRFNRYFSGESILAHFIPGSFFKTDSQQHQSFLIRLGFNVEF